MNIAVNWYEAERKALAPTGDIQVSEWAEKYRMLPVKLSPEPGPWQNDKAPYTVELMDCFKDPRVERISVMAAVQSSKTEPVYNMLAYAIDEDPAPVLIVMPTDKAIKKVSQRIKLMIEDSPRLRRYITGNPDDIKQKEINLKNMTIWFATAGSTADLRHVSARYLYMDEVDDYPPESGDQGSPVELAIARTTTFWNRKIIESCTPTIPEGYINQQKERSDKGKCWLPCPYCKKYQVLDFWQIKHKGEKLGEWPKDKRDPDYIKQNRVACYECEHCGAEIDDKDKPWMLKYWTWIPEGHPIEPDGTVAIPRPRNSHRGFWWPALYSRWRTFSEIAAKFFESKDNPEKLKTFWNLWLALPWKQKIQERKWNEILNLRTEWPRLVVPYGALALTAGIDPQKNGFWMIVRAWFRDFPKSHLVREDYFECSWEKLEEIIFNEVYRTADGRFTYPIWRAGLDTGGGEGDPGEATMTEQAYNWLRSSGRETVFGVMGLSKTLPGGKKMRLSIIDKMPGPGGRPIPGGIQLWTLDTGRIKDAVWSRMEVKKFELHREADEIYAKHLTSEAKEKEKDKYIWKVQGGRANHWWDCEIYAAAMADPECWGGVMVLPDVEEEKPKVEAVAKEGDTWMQGSGFKRPNWLNR